MLSGNKNKAYMDVGRLPYLWSI